MWAALAKAKKDIELKTDSEPAVDTVIKEGSEITITHGRDEKYALWGMGWIWDLPEEYVGEIIRVY